MAAMKEITITLEVPQAIVPVVNAVLAEQYGTELYNLREAVRDALLEWLANDRQRQVKIVTSLRQEVKDAKEANKDS